MKETTFYIVVGILAAVSLTSGFLGWRYAIHQEKKEKRVDGSSFRNACEDNAPSELYPDFTSDFTEEFNRFW